MDVPRPVRPRTRCSRATGAFSIERLMGDCFVVAIGNVSLRLVQRVEGSIDEPEESFLTIPRSSAERMREHRVLARHFILDESLATRGAERVEGSFGEPAQPR